MTEDEMVRWCHRLNRHGFGWTPAVGDGQGGLVCCSSWGRKESDIDWVTELNWTEHQFCILYSLLIFLFFFFLFLESLHRVGPLIQQEYSECLSFFSCFFFFLACIIHSFIYFIYLFLVVLSYIDMNQPWIYMYSPSQSPLPPPSPPNPSGSSQCTRSEHLSHASDLGWWSVSP